MITKDISVGTHSDVTYGDMIATGTYKAIVAMETAFRTVAGIFSR